VPKMYCSRISQSDQSHRGCVGVRSAVGMGSLPDNIPVEIEVMFELA
jgi:enamine deaminase RidA (YjgF/YER057c/UK114 family)